MKKIISYILVFVFLFANISYTNADLYVNYKTCHLNDASCNVANPEITKAKKDKIDKILTKYYNYLYKKYNGSYTDLRYIYYVLLQKIKKIVSRANTYDDKYKIIYYLYYNVESEYYKANNALVLENKKRIEEQQRKVQEELKRLEEEKKKKETNNYNNNTTIDNYNNTDNYNNNTIEKQPEQKSYLTPQKNTYNDSFSKAKRLLERYVYGKDLERKTIYCGCDFDEKKYVDNSKCGYHNDGRYKTRAKKIEWEHVVPAENFGRSFKEWREGDPECVDSKGKSFKGRNCASKVNKEYRYIQADMYNLYPAIGALNALRQNYNIDEVQGEKRQFGKCDFELDYTIVDGKKVWKMEPPANMKGDIARVYMYMDATYPGRGILGKKTKRLVDVWNKIDPISIEECKRYHSIKKYQKNINVILEKPCELVK